MDLGNLRIGITVDSGNAKQELDNVANKVEGVGSKLAKFGKVAAAGTVAAGAAITAFATKAVNDYLGVADRIDKTSQKMGMSAEAFQEWDYVFSQNGASLDGFSKSMKTMNKNLLDGSKAFRKLGVDTKDANGHLRSNEEVMNDTILALAGMEDETKRNALAQEVFGNQYTELLPLLNQGSEALEAQKERAHELGLVIEDEAITAGVNLGDSLADIKNSFGTITTQIAIALLPLVQKVADFILAHMPEIQAAIGAVKGVVEAVVNWVVANLPAIQPIISAIISIINAVIPVLGNILSWVISVVSSVIQQIIVIKDNVVSIVNKVREVGSSLYFAARDAFNKLLQGFKDVWHTISSWVEDKINWIKGKFGAISDIIGGIFGASNGSHRTGLREVPFDGYIAQLHKGEMVLTAPEANAYQKHAYGTQSISNITVNNYSPKALTEAETARQFRKTARKLELGF